MDDPETLGDRVTIRISKDSMRKIDDMVEEGIFPNQSAGLRAAIRQGLEVIDS